MPHDEEKAAREYYQREKPTPDQILAESGQAGFIPQGAYMELTVLRHIARKLLSPCKDDAALDSVIEQAKRWAAHYEKE